MWPVGRPVLVEHQVVEGQNVRTVPLEHVDHRSSGRRGGRRVRRDRGRRQQVDPAGVFLAGLAFEPLDDAAAGESLAGRDLHRSEAASMARTTCPAWPARKALRASTPPGCAPRSASCAPSAPPATCVPAPAAASKTSDAHAAAASARRAGAVTSTYTSSTEAFSVSDPAPHVSLMILSTRAPKER